MSTKKPDPTSKVSPQSIPKKKPDRSEASAIAPRRIVGSGRWYRIQEKEADPNLTAEQFEKIEKLQSLGYVGGSVAAEGKGVTVYDRERSDSGLNFFSSGHAPEAILMDMDGSILHRWVHEFFKIWPDYPKANHIATGWWRRVHLFENGDILAIFEGLGIIKLDKDSNVIWANPVGAHHDMDVRPGGRIYVLTRQAHMVPQISAKDPILEDFISILDFDGNELKRFSLLEAFEKSRFKKLMDRRKRRAGDIFHTNTIKVLDGRIADRHPAFRKGNVLTSMNALGVIAVVDLDQVEVVWAHQGPLTGQHDPDILGNGNLLFFDNRERSGRSRVVEMDLQNMTIKWKYPPAAGLPLYSTYCGAAKRLNKGNTLITESDSGRALEVTKPGKTVWEYRNPHRAGMNDEFIASISEMRRLPPDFPVHWARNAPGGN